MGSSSSSSSSSRHNRLGTAAAGITRGRDTCIQYHVSNLCEACLRKRGGVLFKEAFVFSFEISRAEDEFVWRWHRDVHHDSQLGQRVVEGGFNVRLLRGDSSRNAWEVSIVAGKRLQHACRQLRVQQPQFRIPANTHIVLYLHSALFREPGMLVYQCLIERRGYYRVRELGFTRCTWSPTTVSVG